MRDGMRSLARQAAARTLRALRIANYWLIAKLALAALRLLRLLPAERALAVLDRAARRVGPLMGRHRTALANLRAAFPQKDQAELEEIASDMWANMARLAGEYVFMEKLLQARDPEGLPLCVDIVGRDLFERLRKEPGPRIFFTGHTGNFELLPIMAAQFGLSITALFRAPNNPFLAAELLEKREASMGDLVASDRGSAFALARILDHGGGIGVLVDQKFIGGIDSEFFGRPCQSSPLLAKLARQYECPVHPARCVRLPGNRFRVELHEAIELPRTPKGRVDIDATTRLLDATVEAWVRDDPGQWMWFHRRWEIRQGARRRPRPASG